MAFCSFTKDGVKNLTTTVENNFITDYLLEADGQAVKVYLYGLYVCKNSTEEINFTEFCQNLFIDEETAKDCFRYWEDFDLVTILSEEPFTVKYLPLTHMGKPRKFKTGKYDEFNKSLQSLISERMISTGEYVDYFSLMEDYNIKPEAMLMICKYCVDIKGANIGGKYITAVAKDFAMRGITTVDTIEIELADYFNKSNDIQLILSSLGLKRKADVDDLNYFNKWIKDFNFEIEIVSYVAKQTKAKSVLKLDETLTELFSAKVFTKKEIEQYLLTKAENVELARKITRELSVYVEVIKPVLDNYLNPWLTLGYDGETLLFIANYCFKKRKRNLDEMDETVKLLHKKGLISLVDIADYIKRRAKDDEFIKTLLNQTGVLRSPNEWDRKNLLNWREWGFTEDMILEASKISAGRNNPMFYMNTVLGNWKSKGIKAVDEIPNYPQQTCSQSQQFSNARTYTKEELASLITNINDIDFD